MAKAKKTDTKFKKGNKVGRGRPPNSPNKLPKLLKDALLMAAELEGSDTKGRDGLVGFLRHVAQEELSTFCSMLGRIIPLQINESKDVQVDVTYRTVAEVSREMASRGIDMSVVARIMAHKPETIDAVPADEERTV